MLGSLKNSIMRFPSLDSSGFCFVPAAKSPDGTRTPLASR
jgi:hypothetical protein